MRDMVKKLPKAPPLMAALLLWTLSCAMAGAQTIDPNNPSLGAIYPQLDGVTTASVGGIIYITGPPDALTWQGAYLSWGNATAADASLPPSEAIYYRIDGGLWIEYSGTTIPFSSTNSTQLDVYGTIGGQTSQTNTYKFNIQYNDLLISPANYAWPSVSTNLTGSNMVNNVWTPVYQTCFQRSASPVSTCVFTNSVAVSATATGPNSCTCNSYSLPPLQIGYNTDGSTNWTPYSAPITLTNSTTIYWMAARQGFSTQYATSAYAIFINVTMTPGGGVYSNAVTETINTQGAAVQYRVNGGGWTNYTGPFAVNGDDPGNPPAYGGGGSATVQVSYLSGSLYVTNTYNPAFVIAPLAATPAPNGPVNNGGVSWTYTNTLAGPVTLTVSTATEGATILYSLSGSALLNSINSLGINPCATNVYTGPITIANRSYLFFQAVQANYSGWISSPWQLTYTLLAPLSAPVFNPPSGTTLSNQITLIVTEPDGYTPSQGAAFSLGNGQGYYLPAVGAYTVNSDGSISQSYLVSGSGTYTASLVGGISGETGPPASATYTFVVNELVTTPNQAFNSPLAVSASGAGGNSESPALSIYYSTDGTLPTTNSAQFASALTLTNTTTVIWMGYRAAYTPQYVTNTYTFAGPVTASPIPGQYNQAVDITLAAPGSGITYTLDGNNWISYTAPIHLDGYGNGAATLQAYYSGSLTNQLVYTFQAGAPQVTPASTNFLGSLTITATPGASGGNIAYSVSDQNGGAIQSNVPYTNAIVNTGSYSYTFQVSKNGYSPSPFTVVSYVSLKQTILTVTNLSSLTIYADQQTGSPWWQIFAGNAPNNLASAITFAYTLPGQIASIALVDSPYSYYSCYISTNGGTNALIIPLTLIQDSDTASVWTASYNGAGNSQTTSYLNPGVTQVASSTNQSAVQTAQNPGQAWLFQQTPLVADPLTAQILAGSLWLNSNQDYLISVQSTVSGNYKLVAELRQLPSNDAFSNAIPWQPATSNNLPLAVTTRGYNIYATAEQGEQMVMGGQTVWYQIFPSQGGSFMAQVDPYSDTRFNIGANLKPFDFSLLNPEMTIWQGTNLGALTLMADSKVPNPSTAVTPYNFPDQVGCTMQGSNTYYLRIDASASPGEYTLTKNFYPTANNDNFADATLLLSTAFVYNNGIRYIYGESSGNYGATTEAGEPLVDSHSVWFEIITPSAGYLYSSAASTVPGSNVVVYPYVIPSGEAAALPNLAACPQNTFLAAGTPVYLAVCGDETTFNLSAVLTMPPANDYTTNALILSGDAPNTTLFYVYDSYSKADEALDDQIPGAMNSIWWSVTPNNPGTLTVQNPDGVYPNTYWKLFESGQEIPVFDSLPDRRTYQLADTAAYLFRLTVPNTNMGDGHLNFILYPSPTNYQGNPAPIIDYTMETYANGLVYLYSADGIDNATNQPGEPFNHTVWYSWEPPLPNSGLAQVSVSSSNVNYQVNLDGTGIAANPIPCGPADSLLIAVGGSIDTFAVGIDFRKPPSNNALSNAIPVPLGQDYLFYTKYGVMSSNDVPGAADLWCRYDPHSETNVSFYVTPASNGLPVTLQVIQDNQVVGQQTFALINEPPLNITFLSTDMATLRLIVAQPDTDLTLSIQSQALNDNFANAEVINLVPSSQTVSVEGGAMTLTKYTEHIVSNNKNATLEPGEPFSGFFTRDPGDLAGHSLWWQVTTPVEGIFSIKTRPASDLLDIEVTQSNTLPHSIFDFIAWNSTTMTQNSIPADGTVVFESGPGQSYWIRIDTLVGGTGRVDFDVSQISLPAGDSMLNPVVLTPSGSPRTSYYLGKYPSTTGGSSFSSLTTIYGATRQSINGVLENAAQNYLINGGHSQQWDLGQLPLYPAWQTVWHKFTPPATTRYVVQNSASFDPIILLTQTDPAVLEAPYLGIDNNSELTFIQGQTYYFMVDALVPPAATFSGNPLFFLMSAAQLCDTPIDVGIQGLNSDINRDCEDSIPGVISLSLVPSAVPANDSILDPLPLYFGKGYVQDSCTDPYGNYLVRYAEENTNATSETNPNYVDADYMGGAGKTLWWTVTAAISGPMYIDTSDSQMPVIIKVLPGSVLSGGYLFGGGQANFQAIAGMNYLIGMDSAAGTSGMMAFTVYQSPTSPLNDNFANAQQITTPQVCGTLNYSTIEQYESTAATGSIWYKVRNYSQTNQSYVFQLVATNALMDLFENADEAILNCVPEALSTNNITYSAQAGEEDYIRVWTTNAPPSGIITINSAFDPSWYAAQEFITPSTNFMGSLAIQALSQSSVMPLVYYSPENTATNSASYTGPFTITNSQTIDFLVQVPNVLSYHVTNTYIRLPDLYITPSCVFSNQLQITVGSALSGDTVAYMQGPPDGTAPQQQSWLLFPAEGLTITNSAEIDFIVSGNGSYELAQQHYTNTVAAPQITAAGSLLTIRSATPGASLQVQQSGALLAYPTNFVNVAATAPQVQATAMRPGWLSSATDYDFSPVVTNLAQIQIVTNVLAANELDITLVNPNSSASVTWYSIKQGSSTLVSTSSVQNVSLNLNYTCDLQAYAGTPTLSSIGPMTTLHFTATLLMPQMSEVDNQLLVVNPNTVQSDLYINSIDMGNVSQYTLPVQIGVMDTACVLSALANPSPTNEFIPQFTLALTVSPAGETFYTDLPVTITTGQGSLNATVSENGVPAVNYLNVGSTLQLTLDRSASIVASVLLYGHTNTPSTNAYQAQVGAVQYSMPGVIDASQTYNSLTPVILSCATPNVTFEYAIGNSGSWLPLPNNQLQLLNGTFTYYLKATRAGWTDSPVLNATWTAGVDANALVNYVAQYYTIFPGNPPIPAIITATNSALADYPPYSYENLVWMNGASPSDSLQISTPGVYGIYHQVVKWFQESESVFIGTYGPTNLTYVTVTRFDWSVVPSPGSTNDLGLTVSGDTNISDNVYFYKPTWIQAWTNLPLQAIVTNNQGNATGYIDMTPLQNPTNSTMYLIPGNLYQNSDSINLRYWVPNGNSNTTNYFTMKFRTLAPMQFRSATNNQVLIALLSPDYSSQHVNVYYTTNSAAPQNVPFPAPFPMPDLNGLSGSMAIQSLMSGPTNLWMLNSQYEVDMSSITNYLPNGIPPLPIYGQ